MFAASALVALSSTVSGSPAPVALPAVWADSAAASMPAPLSATMPVVLAQTVEPPGPAAKPQGSQLGQFIPMILIGIVFYLVVLRPLSRERNAQQDMLSQLKRNDKVVTNGGLVGIISSAPGDSDEIVLKSDSSKILVRRDSIREVIPKNSKGSKDGKESDA